LQIAALIQLENTAKRTTVLMYVGIKCSYTDGSKRGVHPPFPVIVYDFIYTEQSRRNRVPSLVSDTVDGVFEPAFVVPTSGGSSGFIMKTPAEMRRISFYVPPLQYLLRDGYANMNFEEQLHSAIRTDEITRRYLRSNEIQRHHMYNGLLQSLQRNGNNPDLEDNELLENIV